MAFIEIIKGQVSGRRLQEWDVRLNNAGRNVVICIRRHVLAEIGNPERVTFHRGTGPDEGLIALVASERGYKLRPVSKGSNTMIVRPPADKVMEGILKPGQRPQPTTLPYTVKDGMLILDISNVKGK